MEPNSTGSENENMKCSGTLKKTNTVSLSSITLCPTTITQFTQVEYPGLVINPSRALKTLGGIHKVSQVLVTPKKKLELKFRPEDPYSKPCYGESIRTSGILLRILHLKSSKKKRKAIEHDLIDLTQLEDEGNEGENEEIIGTDTRLVILNGPLPSNPFSTSSSSINQFKDKGESLLKKEEEYLEERTFHKLIHQNKTQFTNHQNIHPISIELSSNFHNVKIPKSPHLSVQVLGTISKTYQFKGMCDFQYLPKKTTVDENILPFFPDDACEESPIPSIWRDYLEGSKDSNIKPFIIPPILSRIDKPIDGGIKNFLEIGVNKDIEGTVLKSSRVRRVIYSHLCNFRPTDKYCLESDECLVPKGALDEALIDAKKRGLSEDVVNDLKSLFENRPIWTRLGVEKALGMERFLLKYLLPCVAYFGLNGPWRSCWIKLGYDPRKHSNAYKYQLIDYRLPFIYREFMDKKNGEVDAADMIAFKENMIPPKSQMFYQYCEINIDETKALTQTLEYRLESGQLKFDCKFGFLDEDIMEFCRYSISRNIENYLFSQNKISSTTLRRIDILDDGIIPKIIYKSLKAMESDLDLQTTIIQESKTFHEVEEEEDDDDEENEHLMTEVIEASSTEAEILQLHNATPTNN